MESIDLRQCLFHAITPFYGNYKSYDERVDDRLRSFLDSGFIYCGKELENVLPDPYKAMNRSDNEYIFLAMKLCHTLPLYGSYRDGEFSAFSEHIAANLAFVFGEDVLEGHSIPKYSHWLSEEICVEGKIPIDKAKAIYYPRDMPMDILLYYMRFDKRSADDAFLLADYKKELEEEVLEIITNPEESIRKCYQRVKEIQEILLSYQMEVPIVGVSGRCLNPESELVYVKKNKDDIKRLLYK